MSHTFSCNRRQALRISSSAAGLAAGLAMTPSASAATTAEDEQGKAARPAAKPQDVASIDAIIAALYSVISGPMGGRDWDRMRSLFHPGARLIPCVVTPQDKENGTTSARIYSVEEFIKAVEVSTRANGFFEREIARRVERFGAVSHVFSTYESRRAEDDPKPFVRGINSFQLFFDGRRWWVVTIFWDSERPGQPIPAEFLGKPAG